MRRTKKRRAPAKAPRKPPAITREPEQLAKVKATKTYTKAVTREHRQAIEQLLLQGHSEAAMMKYMRETYLVGQSRTRRLISVVFDEWQKTDQETRKHERSAQMRRLKKYIRECEGVLGADGKTWVVKPNHQARAKYEELLAKIAGTNAPIELSVNVQVTDAMFAALGNMDEDTVQAMLDEYYENQALAQRARELLPAPSDAAAE